MHEDDLPLRGESAREFVRFHETMTFEFLNARVREVDQVYAMEELMADPKTRVTFANMLHNNYTLTKEEKTDKVLELISTPGNVTVMIGAKRFGKTASAFWAIEHLLERGVKIFWYGYSPDMAKLYPQIRQTFDPKEVSDGVFIVDETAVTSPATDFTYGEEKDKMRQIWSSGHSDYATIYLSQTFGINIIILRAMDVLWFKPFFQMDFDRVEAKDYFTETYEYMKPVKKDENLVIDCQTSNSWFFTNDLPVKWTGEGKGSNADALSKPLRRLKSMKEAQYMYKMLAEAGTTERMMRIILAQRGIDINDVYEAGTIEVPKAPKRKKRKTRTRAKAARR